MFLREITCSDQSSVVHAAFKPQMVDEQGYEAIVRTLKGYEAIVRTLFNFIINPSTFVGRK